MAFEITPSRDIQRLLDIMKALREPDSGCPWDIEQTYETIAPYTIEEAYEVADAIERKDYDELRMELGDLLLQVVYHSQIAEERDDFNFGDVVHAITKKMIRRHPHVFGDEDGTAAQYSARGLEEGTWERIKAEEKAEALERRKQLGLPTKDQENTSILDDVPVTLPPLTTAFKLQKKAGQVGFDWQDPEAVFEKLEEEMLELKVELESGNTEQQMDEIGDVLFTLVNLARHYKIDPETALRHTNHKFKTRFRHIEKTLLENNRTVAECDLDELETLWQDAKSI